MESSIEKLTNEVNELNKTNIMLHNEIPDQILSPAHDMQLSDVLGKIEAELSELKSSIQNLSSTCSSNNITPDSNPSTPMPQHVDEPLLSTYIPLSPPSEIEHNINYIDFSDDNFLSPDQISSTLETLDSEQYTDENGRSVLSYGAKYKYMGSRSIVKEMPTQIQEIMDAINKNHTNGKYELNSCLVNRYSGQGSFLPEHSDDEFSIMPDSNIYTEAEHTCLSGSLYAMSRDSQALYRYRIDKSDEDGVRYSLTFRSVHYSYLNSTLIVGDSNTGKIRFGSGHGRLGAATPGRQMFAATINDINPLDCTSHSDIVLMVATNNQKQRQIMSNSQIIDMYKVYKQTILSIHHINKRCNIIICPVLPTKLPSLNRKIGFFNRLLREDILQLDVGVSLVYGFRRFFDPDTASLKENLANPDPSDTLHINKDHGVSLLVKLIKEAIFYRIQRVNSRLIHSDRTYASATRGGPAQPM